MGWEPPLYSLGNKYRWVTYGENCPICEAMRGRVYTADVFASSGVYPGFHPFCNCRLEKVEEETLTSPMDIFPGYFIQFLGQWGNSLLPFGGWEPYNVFIMDEFMRVTPEGGTIWDAITAFKAGSVKDGTLLVTPTWRTLFESLGWKSWINLMRDVDSRVKYTVDKLQGVDDSIFSPWGLAPRPHYVRPVGPGQSYYWNFTPGKYLYSF